MKVPRLSGESQITALLPGGFIGNLFQSYGPSNASYADIDGSLRHGLMMFNESWAWGVNRSHNCTGNSVSVVHRVLIKCFFHSWMALSAALRR